MWTCLFRNGVLSLLLGLCAFPACGRYWENRVRDLNECVIYDVQCGVGLSADVRATRVAIGVGMSKADTAIGKIDWWTQRLRYEEWSIGIPILQAGGFAFWTGLLWLDRLPPAAGFIGMLSTRLLRRCGEIPNQLDGRSEEVRNGDFSLMLVTIPSGECEYTSRQIIVDSFGIEFGAFVGLGGFRVGLNVAEFLDFVVGFTTADILGDDRAEKQATVR
jgi:hypothetical protein